MELFFELIQVALGNRGRLSKMMMAKEWKRIYIIAEEQTVVGLTLCGVEKLPEDQRPPKMQLLPWIGVVQMIEQQNKEINRELEGFVTVCAKERQEYLVVKGQTVGRLYPKPLWRQSGDIDFLVHVSSSSMSETTGLSEKFNVQDFGRALDVVIPKMVEKDVGFDRNNIRYELHTSLRGWAKKRHQKVWDELIEKEWVQEYYVEIEGVKVRTLSPTLNAAYIFIHLFFHLIREGVSLRQLCDWAMVLHHYKDEINRDELLQILNDLDLCEAYCAFGTILVDKLGLPISEFPVPINDEARNWQEKILEDIFKGGNFGKLNHGHGFMFHVSSFRSLWYKVETFGVALRNSFKYYRLCPSEVGGMIPRLVKGNARIWLKALFNKVRRQSRAQD